MVNHGTEEQKLMKLRGKERKRTKRRTENNGSNRDITMAWRRTEQRMTERRRMGVGTETDGMEKY